MEDGACISRLHAGLRGEERVEQRSAKGNAAQRARPNAEPFASLDYARLQICGGGKLSDWRGKCAQFQKEEQQPRTATLAATAPPIENPVRMIVQPPSRRAQRSAVGIELASRATTLGSHDCWPVPPNRPFRPRRLPGPATPSQSVLDSCFSMIVKKHVARGEFEGSSGALPCSTCKAGLVHTTLAPRREGGISAHCAEKLTVSCCCEPLMGNPRASRWDASSQTDRASKTCKEFPQKRMENEQQAGTGK